MKNLFHKKLSVDNIRPKAEEMQKGKPLLSDAALSDLGTSKAASGKNVYPAESDRNQDKQTEVLNSVQKVISSYNYIPTGNFLLTKDGKIAGLNLNGKQLLHQGRASLKGSLFESFVTDDTKSIFKNFFKRVYNDQANIPCEITLLTTGYPPTYVFLTGSLRKNKELCLITAINITERKQTEILLLQERELYQDIVNNQPAGIYRIRVFQSEKRRKNAWESSENPPYCIELASDRFCEILRITRKEFEDNPAIIADLIHPQDLSEFSIKNEEANTRIIPFRWEGRIVIQGEVSWIHLESIHRVLAIDDVLWTGILYDITRQKQVEEELRVSENKYRELVAKLPDAINIYSEGKIVFVNNECLRLTGAKNAEELIGKQVIDFIHPDYRLLAVERINDLTNNGKALLVIEEKLIRVDGSVIDVEVKAMPILFQNKPAVQSIMRDITERKEADLKTKESQENFIDLFDNAPVGYHEIDTEGRIVRMNQTELTMLGYTADEVLGHYIWSLVSPEEISRKETKKKLSGEQATSKFYEREFCKKDGKLLSVLLRDKLLKDADGHIYGNRTTLLDITERKQSELKLQLSEERFRNIFENSIVGKSITTLDGRLSVNKAFSQIVGYTKEELSHMHWSGFTDKEDIEFNKNFDIVLCPGVMGGGILRV